MKMAMVCYNNRHIVLSGTIYLNCIKMNYATTFHKTHAAQIPFMIAD